MINSNNRNNFLYLFAFLAFSLMHLPSYVNAQTVDDKPKKEIKYRKARSLSPKVAKKMTKVYEALELVDEQGELSPDMETVNEILSDLLNQKDEIKSYDRSIMWNALAYVYSTEEKYLEAIKAYENLLDEPESTIPHRNEAFRSLGRLHVGLENFQTGIKYILRYMDEVETVTAQTWALLGRVYYTTGEFRKALSSLEKAVILAEEEGYKPKENWYSVMAASIGELKAEIGEKEAYLRQIAIYEILVNLYPKKTYFLQLGGIYGQLGREKDYMITLKAAYAKDLLNREGEYQVLAQLLLLNQNPYWAAQVLVSGQEKIITYNETKIDEATGKEIKVEKTGPVIKSNEKNLKLIADSWRMAQEIDKAIPVLAKAAELSKDGKAYVLLGNLYLGEDKINEAIDAIKKGLKKGKIEKISQVHLTLGQAYFELQKFEEAKKEFRIAARDKDKKTKSMANNWIKYTENEEIRVKNLALRRDYIQSQS